MSIEEIQDVLAHLENEISYLHNSNSQAEQPTRTFLSTIYELDKKSKDELNRVKAEVAYVRNKLTEHLASTPKRKSTYTIKK